MKIFIRDASAEVARIDYKGNSFEVTHQRAIVESDDGELRSPITIALKKGAQPYPVGEYRLGDQSFIVDGKYKRLEFARELELVPVKGVSSKAA
jgi:hypothetical protein